MFSYKMYVNEDLYRLALSKKKETFLDNVIVLGEKENNVQALYIHPVFFNSEEEIAFILSLSMVQQYKEVDRVVPFILAVLRWLKAYRVESIDVLSNDLKSLVESIGLMKNQGDIRNVINKVLKLFGVGTDVSNGMDTMITAVESSLLINKRTDDKNISSDVPFPPDSPLNTGGTPVIPTKNPMTPILPLNLSFFRGCIS